MKIYILKIQILKIPDSEDSDFEDSDSEDFEVNKIISDFLKNYSIFYLTATAV